MSKQNEPSGNIPSGTTSADCPRCGGKMAYSPALQVPVCELCGHALDPKASVLAGLGALAEQSPTARPK